MNAAPECEGIAADLLDGAGVSFPINPWELVIRLGIGIAYGPPGARPHARHNGRRWSIYVDPLDRPERQALALLHEVAHVLLVQNMLPNNEANAWLLGNALLFPRREFIAMRRTMTVDQIAAAHPWASHEAAARREVALTSASVLWVCDKGPRPRTYRVTSPGWRWPLREPTTIERETISAAFEARERVELVGGVRAWCVEDPPWVRVLCLSDGEALMSQVA